MDVLHQQCQPQIQAYAECIQNNPSNWQERCQKEKDEVTKCSSQNPIIQFINAHCSPEFKEYDKCLSQNKEEPQNCLSQLEKFGACAEEAMTKLGV